MHPVRVPFGEDIHEGLGLKPQAQTSSKGFCGTLGLVGWCAAKEPPQLVGNRNPASLVGSHHASPFPPAEHRVRGIGPARLPKVREGERGRERERERSHCYGLWDNQFALRLFVPVLLSVSQTVSTALHILDPQHCLFSQLSDAVRTCLSFPWQWPFLRCRFATWRRRCHVFLHCQPQVFSNCLYSFGLHQGHPRVAEACCHSQPRPECNRKILDPGTSV